MPIAPEPARAKATGSPPAYPWVEMRAKGGEVRPISRVSTSPSLRCRPQTAGRLLSGRPSAWIGGHLLRGPWTTFLFNQHLQLLDVSGRNRVILADIGGTLLPVCERRRIVGKRRAAYKPSAINTGRMELVQKLQLIEGMGLLRDDVISANRVVNGLRNSIAHDLNFEISESDIRNVVNAISKFLREIMQAEKGRAKGPLSFVEALNVLTLHSEVERTRHIITRVMNKKGELRLRDVLNKTPMPRKAPLSKKVD